MLLRRFKISHGAEIDISWIRLKECKIFLHHVRFCNSDSTLAVARAPACYLLLQTYMVLIVVIPGLCHLLLSFGASGLQLEQPPHLPVEGDCCARLAWSSQALTQALFQFN